MFSLDKSFTHLSVRPEQVLGLMQSINAVSVKVPGMPTEPATAFLVGYTLGPAEASLIIHLYYANQNRCAAYVPNPRTFPVAHLGPVKEEACEFLESMGFMLDDPDFPGRPQEEQLSLMAHTPVFHPMEKFAEARRSATDEGGLPEAELVIEEDDEDGEDREPEPSVSAAASEPSKRAQAIGRLLVSL